MTIRNKVVSGVKWTTIGTVVLTLTTILKISILARFLNKEDFGLMALVTFVMGFMNLFNEMGITTAILHKQKITKQEYASLYWFNLFAGFLMYCLLLLITPLIADFYNQPELKQLIPLLGLNLIISGIGKQFKTIENKNLLFKHVTLIDIISAIVSFAFAVFLAIKGFGVYTLVYSALLQFGLTNTLYLIMGLKKYGLLFHFNLPETKPFLKIGIYQVGSQFANYFNRDLDILIIGKVFSTDILGGYSLAKQLVFRPSRIINPILTKVASPTLTKFQNDLKLLKRRYLQLVNIIASINIPIYFLLAVFAPFVVSVLYGNEFENIVILVRILSVYMVLRAIGNPIGSLVIATARTDLEFIWNIITLLVLPIFIIIGAQFGIIQITISISLAMLALFVPSWKILINKMTKASLKEYLKSCFVLNYKFIIENYRLNLYKPV